MLSNMTLLTRERIEELRSPREKVVGLESSCYTFWCSEGTRVRSRRLNMTKLLIFIRYSLPVSLS